MKSVVPQFLARTGLALLLVLLFAQASGRAAAEDPLPYTKGFLVTGNYVVGGVNLTEQAHPIVNGFSTGEIAMSGVPANADIVAAYLFWETITLQSDPSAVNGVKFRGTTLDLDDQVLVKKTSYSLPPSNSCWSSGVALTGNMFRADVLSLLPMRDDAADNPTGKRLVNTSDLVANALSGHTVTLPVRSGNQLPESAGASLLVVYRVTTEPLRKVVIYSGSYLQPSLQTVMTRSLQGFYQSSAMKSAKVTNIVASGESNVTERIRFKNANSNAFQNLSSFDPISGGSSSQRGWSTLTYDVSSLMKPGANSEGGFGETALMQVDHAGHDDDDGDEESTTFNVNDCLAWGAVIFSTAVADVDRDGLPDGLEDNPAGLTDPDGRVLPNLNAMGAASRYSLPSGPLHPDIFVEVNAMWAAAGTSYGSPQHPFSASEPIRTDPVGHNHMPTPEVLKLVGDGYAARGITPHFDVGDIAAYHAPNQNPYDPKKFGVIQHSDWIDDYTSTAADIYLVPAAFAQGGELVKETLCDPALPCQFPAYPGTVRWKFGLQAFRDAPVGDDGEQLESTADITAWFDGTTRRVRFDPARRGLFHYLLNAHARAKPKSPEPCLVGGVPGPFDNGPGGCNTENPDFHVPSGVSGRAELPGGTLLVTMGMWTEFVGRPFARAGTIFHELGHNLGLSHGGKPTLWGSKPANTTTYFEPNCKPNYQSSMSYLFQVHGLFRDTDDEIHLDYSGTVLSPINEASTLNDAGALAPLPSYQPVWFAPFGSALAMSLGAPQATRFCSGSKFDPLFPPAPMARVHSASVSAEIDWNGDKLSNTSLASQDVNFDNTVTGPPKQLNGYDDWANIRLDQVGAGTDGYTQELANGTRFGEMAPGTWGEGFEDQADGFEDQADGFEDQADGFEDQADGYEDQADGFEDQADGFEDQADGKQDDELTEALANEMGTGRPYGLTACVIGSDCPGPPNSDPNAFHRIELRFNPSPTGGNSYEVQRKRAGANDNTYATIGTTTTNRFIDPTELADGVTYEYRVRVNSPTTSEWSKSATKTAINQAPVGSAPAADAYNAVTSQALTVAAPGVLANDSDTDSPVPFIGRRAVLVTGPAHGMLALNANGSLTYTSASGFSGTDTFVYKVDDGLSVSPDLPAVPLSPFSADVTVTITVVRPAAAGALFLHGTGATLLLDNVSPTASTPKQKDSLAINFNNGNPWKDIGTWTASGPNMATPTALDAWIGLKNSDDTNTAFDLQAEVYQNNTTLVASGLSRCIKGVRNGPNLAKLVTVTLAPGTVNGTLSLKLRTRIGTNPNDTRCSGTDASHSNAIGLRVYFDATSFVSKLVVQ